MQPTNMTKCSRHGAEKPLLRAVPRKRKALEAERHHEAAYKQGYEDGPGKGIDKAKEVKEAKTE
jgi:hypothetical protein